MPIRDNRMPKRSGGVTIVGLPPKVGPFYIADYTKPEAGKQRTPSLTNGSTSTVCGMRTSSSQSGVTSDGALFVNTEEFYNLTPYKYLCINAVSSATDHTGHRWWVDLVSKSGQRIQIKQGKVGGTTTAAIDISQYTGEYRISIHIYVGYATYGYPASYVNVDILSLGLSK